MKWQKKSIKGEVKSSFEVVEILDGQSFVEALLKEVLKWGRDQGQELLSEFMSLSILYNIRSSPLS